MADLNQLIANAFEHEEISKIKLDELTPYEGTITAASLTTDKKDKNICELKITLTGEGVAGKQIIKRLYIEAEGAGGYAAFSELFRLLKDIAGIEMTKDNANEDTITMGLLKVKQSKKPIWVVLKRNPLKNDPAKIFNNYKIFVTEPTEEDISKFAGVKVVK